MVPKEGRITMENIQKNELMPTQLVTGWRVCINYKKLNNATRKDHSSLIRYCKGWQVALITTFFYSYSGYNQIVIVLEDQEKTTFTYPYATFPLGEWLLVYATGL